MNLNPATLFDMIALTIPKDLHANILIVGSVAAAYEHRATITGQAVQTKDADVVVQPAGAIKECVTIAKRLLADGWRRTEKCTPHRTPSLPRHYARSVCIRRTLVRSLSSFLGCRPRMTMLRRDGQRASSTTGGMAFRASAIWRYSKATGEIATAEFNTRHLH